MKDSNEIYKANETQTSYGEVIGILLLDCCVPFIPGDVANATTYNFPVRFEKVEGYTTDRAIGKDPTIFDSLLTAALNLEKNGVRAITGDCGFMALHQEKLKQHLRIPVFLSSLLQIHFIRQIISNKKSIGIICGDSRSLNDSLLKSINIQNSDDLVIYGLEDKKFFADAVLNEVGTLNAPRVEQEVVQTAKELVSKNKNIGAILLECSCLPPYGYAVQKAVNLPIFDYFTMINYVYNAVVKHEFEGLM